jgi:hypothetical protein
MLNGKYVSQICHREGIAQIEDEALHILHKFGGLPPKIIRTAADRMYRRDLLSNLLGKDNNLVSVLKAHRRLDDCLIGWLPTSILVQIFSGYVSSTCQSSL